MTDQTPPRVGERAAEAADAVRAHQEYPRFVWEMSNEEAARLIQATIAAETAAISARLADAEREVEELRELLEKVGA